MKYTPDTFRVAVSEAMHAMVNMGRALNWETPEIERLPLQAEAIVREWEQDPRRDTTCLVAMLGAPFSETSQFRVTFWRSREGDVTSGAALYLDWSTSTKHSLGLYHRNLILKGHSVRAKRVEHTSHVLSDDMIWMSTSFRWERNVEPDTSMPTTLDAIQGFRKFLEEVKAQVDIAGDLIPPRSAV